VVVPPLLARARREQTGGLCPPVAKAADRVMESAWGAAILGAGRRPHSVPLWAGDRRALAPFSGRRFGFLTGLSPRSARLSRLAEVQARKEHGSPDHAGAYSNGRTALVLDVPPLLCTSLLQQCNHLAERLAVGDPFLDRVVYEEVCVGHGYSRRERGHRVLAAVRGQMEEINQQQTQSEQAIAALTANRDKLASEIQQREQQRAHGLQDLAGVIEELASRNRELAGVSGKLQSVQQELADVQSKLADVRRQLAAPSISAQQPGGASSGEQGAIQSLGAPQAE
jgi:prefoldin subunit 5